MALYDSNDDVAILTSDNFDRLVNKDQLWMINFYARWCKNSDFYNFFLSD